MQHDTPLITMIVAGFVLAYIFGMIANRLRLPPLVGYLVAGMIAGPNTPGFVANQELGAELAELGVILLMFGVGLHFSLKDLMSVRALAIPGAVVQIVLATLLGLAMGLIMGWGMGGGLLFGLALSVASTVVLLKALQDRRLVETERGRLAVGWLIVEDLAMVLAIVLIPAVAGIYTGQETVHDPFVSFVERILQVEVGIWGVLALTVVKVAAFVGFMLIVGRRVIPWALHVTAHTGSRELFRLAVLAIALGVAVGASMLFGVSLALGAFFAGMVLSESELSQRAANETLPLRDAFSVLFFVSVGMLFDPIILFEQPLPVLATVLIIIVGKSVAAFGIVALYRRPVATALTISASLAQIGEFSFILATMGVALGIIPKAAQDLILAGALISIILNPLVFFIADRVLRPRLEEGQKRKVEATEPHIEPVAAPDGAPAGEVAAESVAETAAEDVDDAPPEPTHQTEHTVLVGYGRVGSVIGTGLNEAGAPLVVIEDSDHRVAEARGLGMEVVVGNAASAEVLDLANLSAAKSLVIAIPNGFEAGQVVEQGRRINPTIRIIARSHSAEEEEYLTQLGADTVIMGEREIGLGMLAWLRGQREETVAGPVAEPVAAETEIGPKLAPVENILAKAAATPAATAAATVVTAVPTEEPVAEDAPAEPEGEPAVSAEIVPIEPHEAAQNDVETPPAADIGAPVESDTVESEESVILMPPPVDAEASEEAAPAAENTPAEPDDVILMPPPAEAPEDATTEDAEPAVETPTEADEAIPMPPPASEGEPSGAEDSARNAERAPEQPGAPEEEDEDKKSEDEPDGNVPPVIPEPKI